MYNLVYSTLFEIKYRDQTILIHLPNHFACIIQIFFRLCSKFSFFKNKLKSQFLVGIFDAFFLLNIGTASLENLC